MKLSKYKMQISAQQVGNEFLYFNETLTHLDLPKLEQVGDSFLYCNETLTHLDLPKLEQVGNEFLHFNEKFKR